MRRKCRKRAVPKAFSLLELQVSFVLFGIAIGGLGPLVIMQSRQLKSIENRLNHQTTHYLSPPTDVWARKLGAAAAIETEDPGTVTTTGSAFEAHINFQRLADPDPGTFDANDYLPDGGLIFGDRGNGYSYGWNLDNTPHHRNRDSGHAPDERYDTLGHMQEPEGATVWEIAVPNGTYWVHLVAGDPQNVNSVLKIDVENVLTVDGITHDLDRFVAGTGAIAVADGRLTISSAAGAIDNKICFIDILPAYDVRILSVDRSIAIEDVTAHVEVIAR
jgi:type II secretory pathway pseudopilin PulG